MKIISVVGARPNFMKVAPLHKALKRFSTLNSRFPIEHLTCHTGQHYDDKMSKIFFEELEIPQPDYYLGVGSGSHAEQTGKVMIEFEKVLNKEKPNLIVVVGDVNSTIACALTAAKMGIKVAHVEAGLRSFDRRMPEEINRILTDSISDFLFVTEKSGIENLTKEGIEASKIFFVGNVMIDSIVTYRSKIINSNVLSKLNLQSGNYCLITLHRPSNVDNKEKLQELVELINEVSEVKKVIFPMHPRTRSNLERFNLMRLLNHNTVITEPVGYVDFISLMSGSSLVLTDSGGVQEETTYLGIPCITLRDTTERPVTVELGTNYLVGDEPAKARKYIYEILAGEGKKGRIPDLWDGKAAERIVGVLMERLCPSSTEIGLFG
jgi:UDP-N-acetylglucosamine 2-epimerase (non-hydrolysing)